MKKFFQFILNLGIEPQQAAEEKRQIKTVNLLNFVMLFFLLIGLTNYFVLEKGFPLFPELLFMCIAAAALFLSFSKKTQVAFLLFTINANLSIFFINQYYPFESGSYLYYFPSIVTVILLNNISSKNKLALVHFIISAVFFLLLLTLDFPQWQVQGLSEKTIRTMWDYNIIMTVVITALVSGLLNWIIGIQNTEILKQNEVLNAAKLQINVTLKEKEVLLAELNHRVKNNLAIITGLLNLQSESAVNSEAKEIISESRNRILSMALVHEMLYNHPQLKKINLGNYSDELIKGLFNSSNLNELVELKTEYDQINVPVDLSIPFGLILNEIVTNSIKYVFKKGAEKKGEFHISIRKQNEEVVMTVKDSGSGFPHDMNGDEHHFSLGLFLIKSLAQQIDGQVHFSNENGARVQLKFMLN